MKNFSGNFLNDILLIGPDVLRSLWITIFKFRGERIVLSADIEKSILQVRVEAKYKHAVRWWKGTIVQYNRHFRAKLSPTCAYALRERLQCIKVFLSSFSTKALVVSVDVTEAENLSNLLPEATLWKPWSWPIDLENNRKCSVIEMLWKKHKFAGTWMAFTEWRIESESWFFFQCGYRSGRAPVFWNDGVKRDWLEWSLPVSRPKLMSLRVLKFVLKHRVISVGAIEVSLTQCLLPSSALFSLWRTSRLVNNSSNKGKVNELPELLNSNGFVWQTWCIKLVIFFFCLVSI